MAIDPETLQAAFDAPDAADGTVGLEEEVMLLDAATLDLAPRAAELLEAVGGDPRFKPELPAAQIELVTPPAASVPAAAAVLAGARAHLAEAGGPALRAAGAGVHPFAAPLTVLNTGPRYERILTEYGPVARLQLAFGLHVHVRVAGAGRAVAVHDALRSHLPELAALAANAAVYAGRDTGLASVRPKLADLLPRQGVPPALGSVGAWAAALRWGAAAGAVPEPRLWWWELRLHPAFGTVEIRVPDTQATVAQSAAVAAVAHCLAGRLAERHDAGELPPPAPGWRIAENRWSACRHGLDAELADLETGERRPARERIAALLDELRPTAQRLGCAAELAAAGARLETGGGAGEQREALAQGGPRGVAAWLADRFLA